MLTIISRIVHYGFKNFWRNGSISVATIAIMVLALIVFINLILFSVITDGAVATIQDKIDISVYFKNNTSEDQILNIKQSVESLPEVKNVEYISRDRALEVFKENHKDDPTIGQAIVELNNNPLQASLNIKARNTNDYAAIAKVISDTDNISQYVDTVSYAKNQPIIERLNTIISNVDRGGLALTIILACIAGLVIFNTIWLAIYMNRDEILIMRVVGASNALVRGPYVVEGIIAGVIAAVVSLIVTAPIMYIISPYLNDFIPGLNLFKYFYTHIIGLFAYQLLFSVGIGAVSSFVAVRRYLRH